MCFNVSNEHSSDYYLYALPNTCSGNRTTFANRHELKDSTGVPFIVICLRVENVFGYTVNDFKEVYGNTSDYLKVYIGAPLPGLIYINLRQIDNVI